MLRDLLLAAVAMLLPLPIWAANLADCRRPGPKVPPALAKSAKYGLLVFGPEAKTRVWLAWDGNTLYADRSGAGDLTKPEARLAASKGNGKDTDENALRVFDLGEVRDGARLHKDVCVYVSGLKTYQHAEEVRPTLARDPNARAYIVTAAVEMPGFRGDRPDGRLSQYVSTYDTTGVLQFADRPEDAPVMHFAGPFTIVVQQKATLRINRDAQVYAALATPGVGAGSRVLTAYEDLVPTGLAPEVVVTFAPQKPGASPLTVHYDLKGRC
jgi:hypothetical protein